jgi:hypothetical protein
VRKELPDSLSIYVAPHTPTFLLLSDALGRCFADSEYLRRIRPDEESFLDLHGCDFIVSTENVVLA